MLQCKKSRKSALRASACGLPPICGWCRDDRRRGEQRVIVFGNVAEFVRVSPFPHILADQWLDPELYERLRRSFPHCPPNSGPTGYTLFAGDPDYDRLIAEDEAWARFHGRFHSQAFVDEALAAFADTFGDQARVDLSNARYVPYRESREDKERGGLAQVEHRPDELWVRVDIMQGRTG